MIRGVSRRAFRPAFKEAVEECIVIVGQGDGVDVNAVALNAVKRRLWRRRGGDARRQAKVRAAKIRHAGGAVVDDGQPPAAEEKIAQGGETGVGRGEHIQLRGAVDFSSQPRRCASSSSSWEKRQPASAVASPCTIPIRRPPTFATRCIGRRASRLRAADGAAPATGPKSRSNGPPCRPTRSLDRRSHSRRRYLPAARVPSPHSRAAPGAARRRGRRCEPIGFGVEPVEIAVKHLRHRRAFLRRQSLDCRQRGEIAVEPADYIKRLRREIRRAGKHARRIAIVVRATRPAAPSAGPRRR